MKIYIALNTMYQHCDIVVFGDLNANIVNDSTPNIKVNMIKDFMCTNDLVCAIDQHSNSGPNYTFHRDGIGRSWIDHFLVTPRIIQDCVKCCVIDEEDLNVSDHLPICIQLKLCVSFENICSAQCNPS